jgi:hypothetical protein
MCLLGAPCMTPGATHFLSAGIVFKEWGVQTIGETRPSSGTPSGNPTHPRQEQWQRARPERYTASGPARARWANEEPQIASIGRVINTERHDLQLPSAAANSVILLLAMPVIIWCMTRL